MIDWNFIKRTYKNIVNGIKNLQSWLHIIWNDRNREYYFIEIILLHKLRNMEAYIASKQKFETDEKSMQALRICVELLERFTNSFYVNLDSEVIDQLSIEERDYKVLFSLFSKYWKTWWV